MFGVSLDPVLPGRAKDLLANMDGAQLREGTGPDNASQRSAYFLSINSAFKFEGKRPMRYIWGCFVIFNPFFSLTLVLIYHL